METNLLQKVLYKLFCAGFALLYIWMSWLCLREPQIKPLNYVHVITCAVIIGILCVLLYKYLYKKERQKNAIGKNNRDVMNICLFLLIYLPVQVYVATRMYSIRGTSWDFNVVAGYAMDYASYTGDVSGYGELMRGTGEAAYFTLWPNNIPLYIVLGTVFHIFAGSGISMNVVGIALNIIAIDIAIIFIYLSVRKTTGTAAAGCAALFLTAVHIPLLIYVPIYYTDTLTLPFPIIGYYLWLKVKEELGSGKMGKAPVYVVLMAILLGMGAVLKLSVIFFLIAAAVDGLVSLSFRRGIILVLAILVIGVAVYGLLNQACLDSSIVVSDEEGYYLPKLHWVMMGLQGKGNYYDPDYQLTLSVPEEGRDELVRTMIKIRLENYGFAGMMDHLYRKISFVWCEGTYYSSLKIARDRGIENTWLDHYVNWEGDKFVPYAEYCQGLIFLNWISFAAAGVSILISKPKRNQLLLVALISVFGIFLFECIWEARSRYIFNYLPVFITITCSAWGNILNKRKR
ncbi:MAG: hypothetical protein Q4D71_06915 [Oscillospiraceae bacterium]|nr:hypothetical protein [Oscillospiraceae bacterium]